MKRGFAMKRIKLLALAACLLCPALGLATPRHPARPASNLHSLNRQIRQQVVQIHKDLRSGRLTRAQARTRLEALKNIRRQELEFFQANGSKEITNDQNDQLQQQLRNANNSN